MNDDASPSTADWPRRLGSTHDDDHDHDHDHEHEHEHEPDADRDEPTNEAALLAEQKKKIRAKRIGYLDDLLRNLDILIYAEISAIYYLE